MADSLSALQHTLADRYRIERELGAGGMATVFLAHDQKHDRHVAIKVLRPELSAILGAERFLKEIRLTANLQHPHILPLHDSGEAEGLVFYVMPYVEGESLRDRLNREKQLPVDEAVRIAREVASALDYAHRHGVVHRDIKPENILLHDGQALVADFGIALAVSTAGGTRMTETGMSLGTPHYMSPEQAMGEREITPRSDVYALGCVTYEMLLGEPPFTGPTAQAIVAKVMTEKPASVTARRDRVPAAVEDAVLTALEKLPADRFATAREFADALSEGGARGHGGKGARVARSSSGARLAAIAAGAALLLAGVFIAGRASRRTGSLGEVPSRLAILAPTLGGSGFTSLRRQIALTPAGDAIVYAGLNGDGENVLFHQRLDDDQPTELPGSVRLSAPQISPDGRWIIGGWATPPSVRIPIRGGSRTELAGLGSSNYASWPAEGGYLFSDQVALHRYSGDVVSDIHRDRTAGLRLMQSLDDQHALVVQARTGTSSGLPQVLDLESGALASLGDVAVTEVRYTSGYLVAALPNGTLTAAPFDPRRGRITGNAVQIAEGVSLTGTGVAQIAVAGNGTLAYIPESPRSLVFADRSGAMRPAAREVHNYHAPAFSGDGRRLLVDFTSSDGRDVWVVDVAEGSLSRATFDRDGHDAVWAPDGRSISYTSFRDGVIGIFRTRPGSSAAPESLLTNLQLAYSGVWLPDGSALLGAATNLRPGSAVDIALIENGGRGPIRALLATPFAEQHPAVSPDGRWLAFSSDHSGGQQVYATRLDGTAEQVLVSRRSGSEPVWSADGKYIYYRGEDDPQPMLIAARVQAGAELTITSRETLFPVADMIGTTPHSNYAVSPDGRTFALVRRSPSTRIVVIQNLPALVGRLSGAAN